MFIFIFLCLGTYVRSVDSTYFRIMSYNMLKFSHDDGNRASYFQAVFDSVNPDIILTQEMVNEGGCDTILNRLNHEGNEYDRADFLDGYDTDNMLFYRTSVCSLVSQDTIQTDLRNIAEYVISIGGNNLMLYSCHLKASQGSSNEQRRLQECTTLREYLNDPILTGSEFIIVGDMNFYEDEPAYHKLVDSSSNNNGRASDLLQQPGDWHDNEIYSGIHTQSSRDSAFGGGAYGGLDDRFDFIFAKEDSNDSIGIGYIEGSYRAYGNDGNHFNQGINDGANDSVSSYIADCLFNASDHLPVYADFVSLKQSGIAEEEPASPLSFNVKQKTFQSWQLTFSISEQIDLNISVYDITGQKVKTLAEKTFSKGNHYLTWEGDNQSGKKVPCGTYFLELRTTNAIYSEKLVLLK